MSWKKKKRRERQREKETEKEKEREREQSGVSHVRALMPGERESERNGYT